MCNAHTCRRKRKQGSAFIDDEASASDNDVSDDGDTDLSDIDDVIDDDEVASELESEDEDHDEDTNRNAESDGPDIDTNEDANRCLPCDIYIHNENRDETKWSKSELIFELKLHMQSIDGKKAALLQRYQSYKCRSHTDRFLSTTSTMA